MWTQHSLDVESYQRVQSICPVNKTQTYNGTIWRLSPVVLAGFFLDPFGYNICNSVSFNLNLI